MEEDVAEKMRVQAGQFGVHLKAQRELRGWKQRALAQRAGISHQMVSEIERGQAPSWGTACALAAALEVPLAVLAGDLPWGGDGPWRPTDAIEIRVLQLCRELTGGPRDLRPVVGTWLQTLGASLQEDAPAPPD